jgi:hypothetical protein
MPAGVDLTGSWRLNRDASQDPQALLAALSEKEMKRMRRAGLDDEEPFSGEGGTSSRRDDPRGEGGSHGGGGGHESQAVSAGAAPAFQMRGGPRNFLRSRYGNALGARMGGDGLSIEQSPTRFTIIRGDSRRSYTPGGHSVVSVADGVADQNSGWKGREFVIDVRPQVGPHLTERFGLTADGRLVEKVSLAEDGLPKLEFTRVYDRGAAPVRALPTSN